MALPGVDPNDPVWQKKCEDDLARLKIKHAMVSARREHNIQALRNALGDNINIDQLEEDLRTCGMPITSIRRLVKIGTE